MTAWLDLEDLLRVATLLQVGPVRDLGLLESAARRPATTLYGAEAYPELSRKAAALMESIVRNHPLVDGDKRLGWTAAKLFLRLNGVRLPAPHDEAYEMVIGVAEGRIELTESAAAFERWSRPVCD